MNPLPDADHIVSQAAWDISLLLAMIGIGLAGAVLFIDMMDWLERNS